MIVYRIANWLHELNCDELSVSNLVRHGKRPLDSTEKPRPIKLTLASEIQKKILRRSENLNGKSNNLEKVFLHQDLAPKQQETRHQLVKELKQRTSQGEVDLIIVNGKIVKRWKPKDADATLIVSNVGAPMPTV